MTWPGRSAIQGWRAARQPVLLLETSDALLYYDVRLPKNVVDSEMMAELLQQAGHKLVTEPRRADAIIVNTCGFIETARQESFAVLQELAATKKRQQWLVAAGCLAERYGDEIRRQAPEVDAIIGTQSWPQIVSLLERLGAINRVAQ
jgi:ribosomal protein S12 methylthiotransferase